MTEDRKVQRLFKKVLINSFKDNRAQDLKTIRKNGEWT